MGRRIKLPLTTGLIAMLFVDAWAEFEVFMNTHSEFLLLIFVLSSVKLFVLFPVGFVVGLSAPPLWRSTHESRPSTAKIWVAGRFKKWHRRASR